MTAITLHALRHIWKSLTVLTLVAAVPAEVIEAKTRTMDECLLEVLKERSGDTTIAEVQAVCRARLGEETEPPATAAEAPDVVEERLALEAETTGRAFTITPHRPNYLLPVAYNSNPNEAPFEDVLGPGEELQNVEAKFQISFKFPLWYGLYKDHGDLYFAYTNVSFWQVYNSDISAPFRETNHEPELFVRFRPNWEFYGLSADVLDLGVVHQSNGRSSLEGSDVSRSWNRVFANFVLSKGDFALGIKPWIRIPEAEEDDDNPDIYKYMGYGEARAAYVWNKNVFTAMGRYNFRSEDQRGALELTWSYPITGVLRAYAQAFTGYAPNLIDYNTHTNYFGIGVAINDYLQ